MATATKAIYKTDRIWRGYELIGKATFTGTQGRERWQVQSDVQSTGYTVTAAGCECYDYQETLRCQEPCKHMWASVHAGAAEAIVSFRRAKSEAELVSAGRNARVAFQNERYQIQEIGRAIYRKCLAAIRALA